MAGDDWTLVTAGQFTALSYMYQHDHARAAEANEGVAALAERLGDSYHVSRRWFYAGWIALADGRFAEARDRFERMLAAIEGIGDPTVEAFAEICRGLMETWEGDAERALTRLEAQLQRSLKQGARAVIPMLFAASAFAEVAVGRFGEARGRLEALVPLVEGRDVYSTMWALSLLAEARRLLADEAAEADAKRARAIGERVGNRLLATRARLTLGRLAAARGDWRDARQHAQAHLDACVEGGHATYVPACLDALAEAAAGLGEHREAVHLFAAADTARAEVGVVRVPPESEHWATIQRRLLPADDGRSP